MEKIDFVTAENKGINIHLENGKTHFGKTVPEIAKLIKKYKISDNAYFGSSMDFASEYGYKNNNGAKVKFNKALKLSKKGDEQMNMNNEEDFAFDIGKLWEKYDEGEITKEEFNKQIKRSIKRFQQGEEQMKHISSYLPKLINYRLERYFFWLDFYEHFENKEELAHKRAKKDFLERKENGR